MSKRIGQIMSLLGCIFLLVGPCQNAFCAESLGSVGAVEGDALLRRSGQPDFMKAQPNENVRLYDALQTERASKLYLRFDESSHASLAENSEFYIFDAETDKDATFFGGDVSAGSIRFIKKLRDTRPVSSYTITTPTAMINIDPSDKPTDFVVTTHNQRRTTITVIRGRARVKNIAEDVRTERIVDSCRSVSVEEGREPSRPVAVSNVRLRELIEMTTIPNTLTMDAPECEGKYVLKPDCPRCSIWDGSACLPCEDAGLVCVKGKCVNLDCGPCKVQWGDRCVPCRELGMVCENGRCVRKFCPPFRIWDGRRCVRCEELGRICIDGRCVRPLECPPCSLWNGRRCVGCAELGMMCIGGRCVARPCGPCEERRGASCVSCAEQGLPCDGLRCIRAIPLEKPGRPDGPDRPDHVSPIPRPGVPPVIPPGVLPPVQGIAPVPDKPARPPKTDVAPIVPDGTQKPGKTERPEKPGPGKPPLPIPGTADVPVKPPEKPAPSEKTDKPSVKPERQTPQRPQVIQGTPKPMDTEPGPRPRPMPEAPKLDQRRESRPERQKIVPQVEQTRPSTRPQTEQRQVAPERKPDRKPDPVVDRPSPPVAPARQENRIERTRPDSSPKPGRDLRDDDRK